LLGSRFLQPLCGLIFIHWHSVAIEMAQTEIILSGGVAFTSRSGHPLGCRSALCGTPRIPTKLALCILTSHQAHFVASRP
jgi:hypothetical protein